MAKTYVKGSAKRRTTNFGDIIKLSFKVEELVAFARQHGNQKGYIAFDIVERKEPGQYGDTHSIVLDDWQPSTPSTGAGARQDEQRYEPRQLAQSQGDGFRGGPIDDSEVPF